MLKKEVIKKNQPVQGKFLSNVFLVWNKDRYHRSVINLKMLNRFVSFLHFKMEGLSQLKHLIQERNWMCKPDLKDAYFIVHWTEARRSSQGFIGTGLCMSSCDSVLD